VNRAMSEKPVNESAQIRVLCVDDHPLLRKGIATMIRGEQDMSLIGEGTTGEEGIELFRRLKPDVTLMDLRLPGMSGVDAIIAIREEFPEARIIVLTTEEGDAKIQRALAAGARAYMLKTTPPEDIIQTIRDVHSGKKRVSPDVASQLAEHYGDEALTAREIEVLHQLATGNRNQDIAKHLRISEQTVKIHVAHILGKLGVRDRTEAVAVATRRGIIQL